MSKTFDKEAIKAFIVSDQENLQISLGVLSVESEIREHIIDNFLSRLEKRLLKEINKNDLGDDWSVSKADDYNPIYTKLFQLTKKSWENKYSIVIQSEQSNANRLCYGIPRGTDGAISSEGGDIDRFLTKAISAGKYRLETVRPNISWHYCPWVEPELANWGSPETLSLLAFKTEDETNDRNKALEYFCDKFISLAKITNVELDKILQSN